MPTLSFSEEDLRAIAHDRYHHPDPRVQQKMEVLWLTSHGLTQHRVATYACVKAKGNVVIGQAEVLKAAEGEDS